MPKLRVSVGPDLESLSPCPVNRDSKPFEINSNVFQGKLVVRLKDFKGEDGTILSDTDTGYFAKNPDMTWSIQVQGRFLQDESLDEVVFGNIFERPIRDQLPYGTSLAIKFVHYLDPALKQDLYADKPWAWSPLVATMNRLAFLPLDDSSSQLLDEWKEATPEDVTPLYKPNEEAVAHLKADSDARRKHFSVPANRDRTISKDVALFTEFRNGFIDFQNLALKLPVGHLQFNLARYWDGQPVIYICKSEKRTFFVIKFDLLDTEGVDGVQKTKADFAFKEGNQPKSSNEEEPEQSTDVD